ncbi:MAG: hypothetical protein AAGU27_00100 [Dehalobacterium sp.]
MERGTDLATVNMKDLFERFKAEVLKDIASDEQKKAIMEAFVITLIKS